MSIVSLHSINIAFGGPLLLEDVSLDIQKGQRICFLGRNGAGKSTFLKILAGEIKPDSGEIITAPGVKIAYLPQEIPTGISGTVFDVVAAGVGEVGTKLAQHNRLLAANGDPEKIAKLHQYLDHHDGWSAGATIKRVLEQTGLAAITLTEFATLSGGMRRRTLLARALAQQPQLLLLDEPTNHLDIDSITWLESFLITARLTVLFVTHDRRLLKAISTRIIELDRGHLVDWSCDYETFLIRKQAVLDSEEKEWERFDKKLAQEEVWIRRGVKARRTRNEGRVRELKKMREERRKRRERTGTVSMTISNGGRSGDRVLEAKNVCFAYGATPLVANLNTTIMRGDRIGIIGPNGCGKTTLLNLLLGKLEPQQGSIRFDTNIEPVYFDQLREVLQPNKTVWENVAPNGADQVVVNGISKHVISYLQDFLFTTDRAKSPVIQLSGGERNRLMLARLFTQPANVLIFDEPTNDLDAETLELLEEILLEYKGTVLVVSHDREFLNNVVTDTLVFEGDGIVKEYVGGYDDWQRVKADQRTLIGTNSSSLKSDKKLSGSSLNLSNQKKLSYKESKELEELPTRIEALEKEHADLCEQLADPACYSKPRFVIDANKRIAVIDSSLKDAYERWSELSERG